MAKSSPFLPVVNRLAWRSEEEGDFDRRGSMKLLIRTSAAVAAPNLQFHRGRTRQPGAMINLVNIFFQIQLSPPSVVSPSVVSFPPVVTRFSAPEYETSGRRRGFPNF